MIFSDQINCDCDMDIFFRAIRLKFTALECTIFIWFLPFPSYILYRSLIVSELIPIIHLKIARIVMGKKGGLKCGLKI